MEQDALQFLPAIQGLVGGIVTTVCFVVLWLKTGHSVGWAMLGVLPLIVTSLPMLALSTGVFSIGEFYIASFVGWLVYIAHLLVLTFKRWPIQGGKPEEAFE